MAEIDHHREDARARLHSLTPTELRILECIVDGASNREIAQLFGIGLRDVESKRECVMAKIGAATTADAVRIGIYAELDEIG